MVAVSPGFQNRFMEIRPVKEGVFALRLSNQISTNYFWEPDTDPMYHSRGGSTKIYMHLSRSQ